MILFVGGGLVAIGMIISFYGSYLVTQDLVINEGTLSAASSIEVTKELDPAIAKTGVYVVRAENLQGQLVARIIDPNGNQIISNEINQKSTEEQFQISTKGDYKLLLINAGTNEVPIIIGLTHMPEKFFLALNLLGQSIIISGFAGVGIAVIYEIKSRRKKVS